MGKRKKAAAPAPESEPVAPEAPAAPAAPVEEQRVTEPEAEVLSLAVAEEAGVLPDEDRRAPEGTLIPDGGSEARVVEPAPELPAVAEAAPINQNDQLHVVRVREDGVKVNAAGSILE